MKTSRTKQEVFTDCYEAASGCELGDGPYGKHEKAVPFAKEDVEEVLLAGEYCGCGWDSSMCDTWCDTGSVAVVRLKDGRFGVVSECSDSSGHG